jgi:uncharacterized membrane-anchored protein
VREAGYLGVRPQTPARQGAGKVPEVTAFSGITQVPGTFMGEAASGYRAHTISPYLAAGPGFAAFGVSPAVQFAVPRYAPA